MNKVVDFPSRDRGFVPARLIEARLAAQMTRIELGRRLGVSGQAIGYYEAGARKPDMSVVIQLADVFGQPISYFLKPDASVSGLMGARFFRKVGPKSNRINDALDVQTKWLWENVQFLLRHIRLPEPRIPLIDGPLSGHYTAADIEAIAEQARRHWGLGDGPIANVVALLETNGVIITRFEFGRSDIDAFSAWVGGRPYVVLGSDKGAACRSRFDAAHELGHIIMHRGIAQEDMDDAETRRRIEWEANVFAGAFLLPRVPLLSEFYSTRMRHLQGLKARWKVSMQAIAHRAKDIGLLDEEQYILFRKQVSKMGIGQKEPLDETIPQEQATLLLKAWRLLMEKKIVEVENFEHVVGFSMDLVQRLHGKVPERRKQTQPVESPNVTLLRKQTQNDA